jgi:hypothetical protein
VKDVSLISFLTLIGIAELSENQFSEYKLKLIIEKFHLVANTETQVSEQPMGHHQIERIKWFP